MKKILNALAILFICAGLSACSAPAYPSVPQVVITENTKDWYDEENGNWLLHLEYADVEVQGKGFEAAAESIADWFQQNAEELLAYGEKLAQEAEEAAEEAVIIGIGWDPSSYSFYHLIDKPEVMRADSRVISLRVYHSIYLHGAHDIYGYAGVTFDAQTGRLLELEDIVEDMEAFRQKADDYMVEKLQEEYGDWLIPDYADVVKENWEYGQIWYLDGAGITIVFDPYELGSFSMGAAEVTLPYELFGTYINEAYRN